MKFLPKSLPTSTVFLDYNVAFILENSVNQGISRICFKGDFPSHFLSHISYRHHHSVINIHRLLILKIDLFPPSTVTVIWSAAKALGAAPNTIVAANMATNRFFIFFTLLFLFHCILNQLETVYSVKVFLYLFRLLFLVFLSISFILEKHLHCKQKIISALPARKDADRPHLPHR